MTGAALLVSSDEQLLTRAIAGNRECMDELFRRYRLIAYRVAFRLLSNEADALDAVQEAFVKALTHLPSFEGRSSFKTWLLRVVSNASLDLGRQRGRREAVSMDALGQKNREDLEPLFVDELRDGDSAGRRAAWNRHHRVAVPAHEERADVFHAHAELH